MIKGWFVFIRLPRLICGTGMPSYPGSAVRNKRAGASRVLFLWANPPRNQRMIRWWPSEQTTRTRETKWIRFLRATREVTGFYITVQPKAGLPGGSEVKNPPVNAGDTGSIPDQEDPLEKEMVTHSSVLAWENLWREDPGRLQSMGITEESGTT